MLSNARRKVRDGLDTAIDAYIARLHKWPSVFLSIGVLICVLVLLPVGHIDPNNLVQEVETLISPTGSTSLKQKGELLDLFGNSGRRSDLYYHQNIELGYDLTVIYKVADDDNILNETLLDDVTSIHNYIASNINVTDGNTTYTFSDLCARRNDTCAVEGAYVLDEAFKNGLKNNNVTWPEFQGKYLQDVFGNCDIGKGDLLTKSTTIKFRYLLRNNFDAKAMSSLWVKAAVGEVSILTYKQEVVTYFPNCIKCSRNISIYLSSSKLTRDEIYSDFSSFDLSVRIPLSFWPAGPVILFSTGVLGVVVNGLLVFGTWGILSYCGYQIVTMLVIVLVFLLSKLISDKKKNPQTNRNNEGSKTKQKPKQRKD